MEHTEHARNEPHKAMCCLTTRDSVDGKTPAMRLGLAKRPLAYEDILWLGQRAPRPKRSRRKGMKAAA